MLVRPLKTKSNGGVEVENDRHANNREVKRRGSAKATERETSVRGVTDTPLYQFTGVARRRLILNYGKER
jgi:hypothetical protein